MLCGPAACFLATDDNVLVARMHTAPVAQHPLFLGCRQTPMHNFFGCLWPLQHDFLCCKGFRQPLQHSTIKTSFLVTNDLGSLGTWHNHVINT